MNTNEFLAHLHNLDIKLTLDGERLKISAPKNALDATLRTQLTERKAELIAFLSQGQRIPIIPRDQKLPLSFAQERLWFIDQLTPNQATYNLPIAVHLQGTFKRVVLEQTLPLLIQRHEILRTAFLTKEGQPYLVIQPHVDVTINYQDFRPLPPLEQEEKLNQAILADTHKPFDLKQLPLFRVSLFQMAADEHVLLFNFHHIIFDGWSRSILWQDLFSLYESCLNQTPNTLPELTTHYVDYAMWQQQRLQGEFYDKQVGYWQKQLSGTLPLLELPTDWPRPPKQDFSGGHQTLTLSVELSVKLQTLSQNEGCTLFMVLLAAFQLLLHRYSGQDDIIVGSPIATRQQSETEQMIGMFLNNLVLRGHIVKTATFREFLRQTRQTTLEAYTHQELPFEKLVEVLQPPRDPSRSPIFEVMLNLLNLPQAQFNLADLTITRHSLPYLDSNFSMTLYVLEKPSGLTFDLVYQRALFSAERMAYLLAQFEHLLEQIVISSDLPLHRYSLVTPTSPIPHPTEILPEPRQTPITELIARWRDQIPEHPAIKQGALQWNYRQLVATAETFAQVIVPFSQGEVIAVTGQKSFGLISSMLGVLTSNNTLLMLDPNLPSYRHQLMLQQANVNYIIYVGPQRLEDAWMWDEYILMFVDPMNGMIEGASEIEATATIPTLSPDSPAYIFFTSGTTGVPKAVLGCHKGLSHFLQWQSRTFNIGPQDRAAQLTGLSFDVVLRDIFTPLISGATLCLPTPDLDLSPGQLLPWLERERITLFHTVPSLASTWLALVPKGVTLQNLRLLFLAGEPLTQTLVEQWRRAFPQAGDLINLYGPTETTLAKCYYPVPHGEVSFGVQPVGRPMPETQALVMSEFNTVCGISEMGEIVIRTPFRSLGYLNNPTETQARFFPNPTRQDPHDWLYRTGDLGRYRPNGLLEILGRVDDQIKVRGIRIELGEIATILGQHPNVQQQVIIAHKQSDFEKILVAYIVFRQPTTESIHELRQFLKQKLPDSMIPSIFMPLEAIPLTANGKVDRRALPAPSLAATETAQGFIAPRDDLELQMTKIWENILKVNPISVMDNFFELGGHSLLAVRLFTEIERVFGRNMPLATLFQAPTVEQLVNLLRDEGWAPSWSSLVPLQPKGSKTPVFCVHAIGGNVLSLHDLAHHLGANQPFYALQSQGLDGKQSVPKRLEDMAASYLEEIRTVQPHGPYYILGQSSGGLVAFEMAQQLVAQGETVSLLALIDTYEPTAISANRLPLQARVMFHLQNLYKFHVHYLADRIHGTIVFRLRNKVGLWTARTVQQFYRYVGQPVPHQFRYTEVRETIRQALSNYKPQPYPGAIVLFRATETFLALVENQQHRQRGWSKLAEQGLVVYDIPGAHNLEQEPHVGHLAEKLVKLLA